MKGFRERHSINGTNLELFTPSFPRLLLLIVTSNIEGLSTKECGGSPSGAGCEAAEPQRGATPSTAKALRVNPTEAKGSGQDSGTPPSGQQRTSGDAAAKGSGKDVVPEEAVADGGSLSAGGAKEEGPASAARPASGSCFCHECQKLFSEADAVFCEHCDEWYCDDCNYIVHDSRYGEVFD